MLRVSLVNIKRIMKTYILVDCGYLFFYRYHATKLWYKKAHTYTDDLTMAQDIHFQTTYQKMVKNCIQRFLKKYSETWEHVIFCRDSRRESVWRNSLNSEYKGNRDTSQLTGLRIASKLLKLTIFELVREEGAKSIGVAKAEADDIVYCCTSLIRVFEPDCKCVIIASDQDYYQILDEKISLVRLDKRDPMTKSTRVTLGLSPQEAAKIDLLVKIISGDNSDNIKAIFPKCGPKTALKLAQDEKLLNLWFEKHNSSKSRFIQNKSLIDMTEIPAELQFTIGKKIKICLYSK